MFASLAKMASTRVLSANKELITLDCKAHSGLGVISTALVMVS